MATAVLPVPAPLTSSFGLLAMLEESETQIKVHALQKLERVVPDFWAEISESLPDIEALYEDEAFPQRRLAALVASKVYYYLGEYADALVFALGAEALFNVDEGSECAPPRRPPLSCLRRRGAARRFGSAAPPRPISAARSRRAAGSRHAARKGD